MISLKPCGQPNSCDACRTKWKDPSQLTLWDKASKLIERRPSLADSETWSNLKKVIMTVGCPKCGAYIQKNGGCSHMVCTKCQHQFCWLCQQPHFNYRHNQFDVCGVRTVLLFFIYAFISIVTYTKLGYMYPPLLGIPLTILYWIFVMIVTLAIGGSESVCQLVASFSSSLNTILIEALAKSSNL